MPGQQQQIMGQLPPPLMMPGQNMLAMPGLNQTPLLVGANSTGRSNGANNISI